MDVVSFISTLLERVPAYIVSNFLYTWSRIYPVGDEESWVYKLNLPYTSPNVLCISKLLL